MRIAIDATSVPASRVGAGNYIFNLVKSLAQVDASNQYVVFAKPADIAALAINQRNFRFAPVSLSSRPTRLIWEQTVLPYQLKRISADLLHSPHYTMPLIRSCRSVVTLCDMTFYLLPEMHEPVKTRYFRLMMQLSSRRADKLVAISESTRFDARKILNIPADRIVTTPLGVGPQYRPLPRIQVETICASHNLTAGNFILYVGTLEPRKNIATLIRAYASIARELPDTPLVIAGRKGWFYEETFSLVTQLGIESRVRFLGYVADDDLCGLYNGAKVFVYPSLYEGFGLPPLEAMASGCPVITSNVSSMPEVVGDAGILINPCDVDELARAIHRIATDGTLHQQLATRGLSRAQLFTWDRTARETLGVYERVVNSTQDSARD